MGLTALGYAAWAAVGVSAVTAGVSISQSAKAASEAKDRAAEAARMEAAATAEKVKRLKEENERKSSMARARSAASGVSGASSEIYMAALEEAGREEISWLEKVGASKYQSQIGAGESAYSQATSQMWGGVGELASAGVGAWSTYANTPAKTTTTTPPVSTGPIYTV